MKDHFLVGELATLFDISSDTLRYYDKINLIRPDTIGENGYRYYSVRSFFKLSRILFLKDLGIPLEEIKDYMEQKNTSKLVQMLEQKQIDIEHKIQRCLNLNAKIQQKLDLLSRSKEGLHKIQIKHLPERYGFFLSSSNQRAEDQMKATLKSHQHLLKNSSWIQEGQIYTCVRQTALQSRNFQEFEYLFELAEVDLPQSENVLGVEHLPSSDYACLLFIGPYSHIDAYYHQLLDYIEEHHYEIAGPSIEKNIVDYDFADSDEEYISELQIPIKKRPF